MCPDVRYNYISRFRSDFVPDIPNETQSRLYKLPGESCWTRRYKANVLQPWIHIRGLQSFFVDASYIVAVFEQAGLRSLELQSSKIGRRNSHTRMADSRMKLIIHRRELIASKSFYSLNSPRIISDLCNIP